MVFWCRLLLNGQRRGRRFSEAFASYISGIVDLYDYQSDSSLHSGSGIVGSKHNLLAGNTDFGDSKYAGLS